MPTKKNGVVQILKEGCTIEKRGTANKIWDGDRDSEEDVGCRRKARGIDVKSEIQNCVESSPFSRERRRNLHPITRIESHWVKGSKHDKKFCEGGSGGRLKLEFWKLGQEEKGMQGREGRFGN